METVFAKCGFDCTRCPAFEANSKTADDRKRGAQIWEKYFGLRFKPDVLRCQGCQAGAPWKTGNPLPDRMCPIRACAVHNGVSTCASCLSFPCKEYSRRVPGPGLRQEREASIGTAITDREWRDYLEPYDGQSHLANLHNKMSTGELLPPKPFQTSDAIPFPPASTIAATNRGRLRNLHSLLTRVFSTAGETFAEQIIVDRQLRYVAGLLWVMGFHGRLEDGTLVLNSAEHIGRKECERLIRKSDNRPHESTRNAMSTLERSGITVEFHPAKRGWTFTMKLHEDAGGSADLAALKDYSEALATRHGPPTYVDGFDLRGQAFKDFKRADMSIFQKRTRGGTQKTL